jgi:hypothetical protein
MSLAYQENLWTTRRAVDFDVPISTNHYLRKPFFTLIFILEVIRLPHINPAFLFHI